MTKGLADCQIYVMLPASHLRQRARFLRFCDGLESISLQEAFVGLASLSHLRDR